ncbi:MAG TPA: adenylyltransferase/cytidyltransferase family protein [Pyrinomonadaceae bacterium]|nr:adenylyltransferase/cytidyltransferase family protein [Pyrinomonadaceae bacterium]
MKHLPARVIPFDELASLAARLHENQKTIVLANGCFDLLHVGHIRYLDAASKLGDFLVVAVNSDKQARMLKGEGRPMVPENERAEIIASLKMVDAVVIFDEPTVESVIRTLRPHIHAKGTDYTKETVPERMIMQEIGGQVAIVGDPKDHSSTRTIEKINSLKNKA